MNMVICDVCNKQFTRRTAEINRSARRGMKSYCSSQCYSLVRISNIPWNKRHHPENLLSPGWNRDEFSPFRKVLRIAKQHANDPVEITLDDLKSQWEKQNGTCPLTGWKLQLSETSGQQLPKTTNRASLDRIDSGEGYVKGNIRFIAMIAQFAKNTWTDKEVILFCEAVSGFRDKEEDE